MLSFHRLFVGAFLLALAMPVAAWSQEAEEDPIGKAIKTIESAGTPAAGSQTFTLELDRARKALVERRAEALPRVLVLLDTNNIQSRLNAAIVLTDFARQGDVSPQVLDGLKRCLRDSALAVAYWGFQGLMSNTIPLNEQLAAVDECLTVARPRSLRLVAAYTAGDKKLQGAAPKIIEHMKNIRSDYKAQVQAKLTREIPDGVTGETASERPGAAPAPGPTGAAAAASKAATPAAGAKPRVKRIMIDVNKLTATEIEALIPTLEVMPAVMEMHVMGMIAESLVTFEKPTDAFGFDITPPWGFEPCLDRAALWLAKQPAAKAAATAPEKKAEAEKAPAAADKAADKATDKAADKAADQPAPKAP